ncbi:hypothetical protein [Streptomyces sp. NBC_01304]|uniref:hypothetical protein n=1 Tax=Streptomyces sp. NBC_01304 TaxID=2903818 RepID=UPI002E0D7A73|nr:hypothetical protein OG430_23150 [Streptomyces sp. NBC_01304]
MTQITHCANNQLWVERNGAFVVEDTLGKDKEMCLDAAGRQNSSNMACNGSTTQKFACALRPRPVMCTSLLRQDASGASAAPGLHSPLRSPVPRPPPGSW